MREACELIAAWRSLPLGAEAVLATVVATQGSTYRRPGARMLLSLDGWLAGSISGGCLEGDVVQTAWERTANGPALVTYDASADEDVLWGFGLGCNGVVQVLLERLPADGGVLAFLERCHRDREPGSVATVVSEGPRLGEQARVLASGASKAVEGLGNAAQVAALGVGSQIVSWEGLDVLVESFSPPHALTVFGAGHDAQPLVEAAKAVGWHVTVIDWRPGYARAERFPQADAVRLVRPDQLATTAIEPGSATVVMTHSYLHDLEIVRGLLTSDASYIGLLGPLRRTERLLGELPSDRLTPQSRAKLRAPIGLDLGGDEPATIALAIVAEIQACFTQRSARPLNGHAEPLHDPAARPISTPSRETPACIRGS